MCYCYFTLCERHRARSPPHIWPMRHTQRLNDMTYHKTRIESRIQKERKEKKTAASNIHVGRNPIETIRR